MATRTAVSAVDVVGDSQNPFLFCSPPLPFSILRTDTLLTTWVGPGEVKLIIMSYYLVIAVISGKGTQFVRFNSRNWMKVSRRNAFVPLYEDLKLQTTTDIES